MDSPYSRSFYREVGRNDKTDKIREMNCMSQSLPVRLPFNSNFQLLEKGVQSSEKFTHVQFDGISEQNLWT